MRHIPQTKDFWAGALFIALALGAFYFGSSLPLGTAGDMGPRYFPVLIAIGLLIFGSITMAQGVARESERIQSGSLRSFLIIVAVVLFALLLRPAGLIIAVIATVLVAGLAMQPGARWLPSLAIACILAGFSWLVFVLGLKLPLKAWPL